jgi:hypothetical protein
MIKVRIDDVVIARSDYATAEPLPDGLPRDKYTDPIVVRDDLVLIDGLRRLLWARAQGRETIPAVKVTSFLEAMEELTPRHADRPKEITALRIWNFISILDDYSKVWSRTKASGGWVQGGDGRFLRRDGRTPPNSPTRVREQYHRALNVTHHAIQAATFLYRRADAGDAWAQELARRVESSEMGPMAAARAYKAPNNLSGNVTDQAEQSRILDRGVAGLAAQVATLHKLGHPLVVSTEELTQALKGMVEARTELTALVSGIRRILKERENHG